MTREYTSGNYCGHNPGAPQLELPEPPTRTPLVLRRCKERLERYFFNPAVLPSLNQANGSPRQQRSERREGCIRAMGAILKFCDLASLRVGVPTSEGFVSLTHEILSRHAGISLRRFLRAVVDLKAAGILTVHPIAERLADGTVRGHAAVKAVSVKLWQALGLADMLRHERDKASKRVRKAITDPRARARVSLSLGPLLRRLGPRDKNPRDAVAMQGTEHDKRRYTYLCLALRQEHPDWSIETIRKAAQRGL